MDCYEPVCVALDFIFNWSLHDFLFLNNILHCVYAVPYTAHTVYTQCHVVPVLRGGHPREEKKIATMQKSWLLPCAK